MSKHWGPCVCFAILKLVVLCLEKKSKWNMTLSNKLFFCPLRSSWHLFISEMKSKEKNTQSLAGFLSEFLSLDSWIASAKICRGFFGYWAFTPLRLHWCLIFVARVEQLEQLMTGFCQTFDMLKICWGHNLYIYHVCTVEMVPSCVGNLAIYYIIDSGQHGQTIPVHPLFSCVRNTWTLGSIILGGR